MESQAYLLGISLILVLGIVAQWLAWRIRMPAILLLLVVGCLVGPGTQWLAQRGMMHGRLLDPNQLLGPLLLPVVSLSVAVILFEGGLTLNISDLSQAGRVITRLVSTGALITWLVSITAGVFILRLEWHLAMLLGAILVVTGPTVIGPLLRHVKPSGQVGPILRWEGIVIDPLGALLAVVVFEAIPARHFQSATVVLAWSVGRTVLVGGLIGVAAAAVLVVLLRPHWTPDYLHSPIALMLCIAAFAGSNLAQHESGLFAVTVMGITLANQKFVQVRQILEFKENLSVLLIASLFILLGARLRVEQLSQLNWRILVFIASLVIVARPLAVLASTAGSALKWPERIFLMCMAPRGIVAAAVSSVFALRLQQADYEGGDLLVPFTFAVIIGTVTVYGLTAPWAARRLALSNPDRQGFLIAGANPVARVIASAIQKEGYAVLLVDTNVENLSAARLAGLPTFYGSILSQYVLDRIELSGIGRLLALTPNEEVNSLAALHFARQFGSADVYQIAPDRSDQSRTERVTHQLRGRTLFGPDATYRRLEDELDHGASARKTLLTREFDYNRLRQTHGDASIALFLLDEAGKITFFTADAPPAPRAGQAIITLGRREAALGAADARAAGAEAK